MCVGLLANTAPLMTAIDVTKEFSDILTSVFGKGWGWAAVLLLARALRALHFFPSQKNFSV